MCPQRRPHDQQAQDGATGRRPPKRHQKVHRVSETTTNYGHTAPRDRCPDGCKDARIGDRSQGPAAGVCP